MINYTLTNRKDAGNKAKKSPMVLLRQFFVFLDGQRATLFITFFIIILNSAANIAGPFVLGYAIDTYITNKDIVGIGYFSLILAGVYAIVFLTNYLQTIRMGRFGQELLYKLRNHLFEKIQSLPLAFFNQNKLGDLISRVNNDTDKLNQFFSQSLIQFVGNIFTIFGIGVFIIIINWKLGLVTLATAFGLFIVSYVMSPWVNRKNRSSLQSLGGLSAEISEALTNFKVIVSFDRRDYFKESFEKANQENYHKSIGSGIANTISSPLYDYAGNIAQALVLVYGIHLIMSGEIMIGILVSFLSYVDKFYAPLRQMASVFSSAQTALAAWNRVSEILALESDMPIVPVAKHPTMSTRHIMQFDHVSFGYPEKPHVLKDVSFTFDHGKTYAIVGPTGGGKSTIASVMSRLYDPEHGVVFLEGVDIRQYSAEERARRIGFILQDQFIFSGTVGENIAYGNENYHNYSKDLLEIEIRELGLGTLLNKFEQGLDTPITPNTEIISLGQKQLISFMRAIIRKPALLIMDEATANIDTITESLLQDIINKLPATTTKVIIAHRLNTIKNADEIYFVNNGSVETAESFERSVELISKSKRIS